MADFSIKRGDLLPAIAVTLSDSAGPVNINGGAVKFIMTNVTTTVVKVNAAATNLDDGTTANRGKAVYNWSGTDTDTAGLYYAEVEVTLAGKKLTFPNSGHLIIEVVADLG